MTGKFFNVHGLFRIKADDLEKAVLWLRLHAEEWLVEPSPTDGDYGFPSGTLVGFDICRDTPEIQIPFDYVILSPAMAQLYPPEQVRRAGLIPARKEVAAKKKVGRSRRAA